ncbi:23S rRNA (guanine(745)-N(1))-methyltransferase [Psychromonas sp. RZ22]|uniref:23S rRNA (guanine(745)-N(1))-methyltransferase n=1 Tax=Psychromonas algarum TaxID=2555643 RepID=UPI001067C2B6|nr:23S rRNA (guanine(745)-N(1))-methyltransferase [Psychromonas sp. RZ22]TEW55600.1 23S rRNA (guanine(745)-N(1))-methyltransferase [Psychromonas sp. RZ22]
MTPFICPLCQTVFNKVNNTQVCKNNHHFDVAKENYLNLLPVQAKSSKNPGDNKEMMIARRAFLNTGGYLPLAEKVAEISEKYLVNIEQAQVLDLGCGEGYYTQLINQRLKKHRTCGVDISKVAIRYAAKRYQDIDFCVASAYQVPLADESIDLIIRIYAPSKAEELIRLIKKNGYLITVTPAPRHLYQLREVIYENVNAHAEENEAVQGFSKLEQMNLNYKLNIDDKEQLQNLINMTPFAWKFTPEKLTKLLNQSFWDIECDFNIEIFKKN